MPGRLLAMALLLASAAARADANSVERPSIAFVVIDDLVSPASRSPRELP